MVTSGHRLLRHHLLSLGLVVAATAFTAVISDAGEPVYFPMYLLALALATVLGGWGPGAVALALSVALSAVLFTEPVGSVALTETNVERIGGFLISGLALVIVASSMRTSARRARAAQAQVESFVGEAPMGLGFVDRHACLTHINDALAVVAGVPGDELLGRPIDEALPAPFGPAFASGLRRALSTGRSVPDVEVVGRPAGGGPERHWVATFYPVMAGSRGIASSAGVIVQDVTIRKAAEGRLRFLSEASGLLEAPLSSHERLELLVRLVVPRIADAALFESPGPGGRPQTVAIAHRDPAQEAVLRRVRSRFALESESERGVAHTLRTGETDFMLEVPPGFIRDLADEPEVREDLQALDVRSYIIVPLTARGRRLGALTLLCSGDRRFARADVAFAEDLARRAALALDNARLLEQQTEIARTLQQSLLPPTLPELPGAELAARYRPLGEGSEVGGDFYDAFRSPDGWLLTIGDACGKGVQAATVTALARHTIRALAFERQLPSALLEGLNESLTRASDEPNFLTAAIVSVQTGPGTARVVASSAGHPLPLIVRADGRVEELGEPGTLLGSFLEGTHFHDGVADLAPGDALLLYTDGVIEARSEQGELFGDQRLRELVERSSGLDAHALVDRVEHAVSAFQAGRPSDDLAVFAMRVVGARVPAQDRPR